MNIEVINPSQWDKTCRVCNKDKNFNSFYKNNSLKDGYINECKDCYSQREKIYRNKNRHYIKKWHKDHYKDNVKEIKTYRKKLYDKARTDTIKYYSDGKMNCKCCGEDNRLFLTIDHVNNDGGEKRKNKTQPWGGPQLCRWLILNDFPDGFQILCFNCNLGKARNKGICPHKNK